MTMIKLRRYALRLGALALCTAALSTAPMLAQGGGGGRGGMSPEAQQAQLDAMTKAVGLTDDQVAKVKAINADSMKQMMALRDSGGDPADMRPKMMAIRTDQQTKIKAILTDDQKPKYDAFVASQPRGGRGGGRRRPTPASPAALTPAHPSRPPRPEPVPQAPAFLRRSIPASGVTGTIGYNDFCRALPATYAPAGESNGRIRDAEGFEKE